MLATNIFMLIWGIKLVERHEPDDCGIPGPQSRITYLPIPMGGGLTALLVIESFMTQKFFVEPEAETVSGLTTE